MTSNISQTIARVIAAMTIGIAAVGQAQMPMTMDAPRASGTDTKSELPLTDGVVQKVDKTAGELTLKHGPLASIGMGAMTMAFSVSDPKMLESVTAGDKVRFAADIVNGKPTVTKMETVGMLHRLRHSIEA